jgi:hypothetical protein
MIDKIKEKFRVHRNGAKARGIDFNLTYDQWQDIWNQSGHWEERGNKRGQYCMSRYNDQGPYEIGNVFIQRHTDNIREAHKGKPSPHKGIPKTEEHKRNSGLALKGVKIRKAGCICCRNNFSITNLDRHYLICIKQDRV